MALGITLFFFAIAFVARCWEILNEEKVDNLSLAPGKKFDECEYDTFFAEELEYL